MDEYIERKATLKVLCRKCNNDFSDEPCEPPDCFILEAVKSLPSIDAVPVVRCRECKHMEISTQTNGRYCNVWGFFNGAGDDGFCNYGERKECADNG